MCSWEPCVASLARLRVGVLNIADSPDEVGETQNENADTCELDDVCQIRVEGHDVVAKHGRESEGPETLREGHGRRRSDGACLPERRP